MSADRIPLFPLNVVLFPGRAMPLHIFEHRYRLMTRQCLETKSPFGVIFFHEGNLARVGCSAIIVKILKEYEDGRFDILAAGQHAFRLIRTHEDQPYFEADVEYLEEDFTGIDAGISAQLEQLFNRCYRILFDQQDPPPFETEGSISLAYHVASELPVDAALRQQLLELRSEGERQGLLVAYLDGWYPQLQKREHVRQKAAGNGHAKL